MKIIEKLTADCLNNQRSIHGLISIRIVNTVPMTATTAKQTVLNHLSNEAKMSHHNERIGTQKFTQAQADIAELENYPVAFSKTDKYTINEVNYYYHQIVLSIPAPYCRRAGLNTSLHDLGGKIGQNIYGLYEDITIKSLCPLTDFVYSIGNIKYDGNNAPVIISNCDDFSNFAIKEIMKPINNTAFSCAPVNDKKWNLQSTIEIEHTIHNNLLEAINEKTKRTVMITLGDLCYGSLYFRRKTDIQCGFWKFAQYYEDNNPKILQHKDMFILYDGEKALELSKPFFDKWNDMQIKMVVLKQYGIEDDFCMQRGAGYNAFPIKKLYINFIPLEKIEYRVRGMEFDPRRGYVNGMLYIKHKGHKGKIKMETSIRNSTTVGGRMVIPVNNQNVQAKALEHLTFLLDNLYHENNNVDEAKNHYEEYIKILQGDTAKGEDILTRWFEECTHTTKKVDDGIVAAYNNMRKNLEQEYKTIGTYLSCYDFSKCSAIPMIKMDKKMEKNYYNTLHVEPKNVIINSINNKKISPIRSIQTTVKVIMPIQSNYLVNEYPLKHFYNQQTNVISFNYDEMKGEVIRDKIKNRR